MENLQTRPEVMAEIAAPAVEVNEGLRDTSLGELASMATAAATTTLEALAKPTAELDEVIGDIGFPTATFTRPMDTD